MTQYNRQHNHLRQDFAQLTQNVRTLRHQLVQPQQTLFDIVQQTQAVIGLQQALQTFDMPSAWQQMDQSLQRIEAVVHLLDCPILGVAGLLNSGKSSFVASYLSPAGRRRVLRGDTSDCGTQRFVFWLPEQWRQDALLWADMLGEISALFAGHYEMLGDDPAQAHQQYNQRHTDRQALDTPLIATDPGLQNLALLDCPDVQRTDDAISAAGREAFLRKAAPVCSAFLFVTTQKNIADEKAYQVADSLREMMPDVPFHLVMNQVEADNQHPPHQFLQDAYIRRLIKLFHIDHFYIAYHYKISGWEQYTPRALHALASAADKPDQLPAAWQVSPHPADNALQKIPPPRFLINLPDQLEVSDLAMPQVLSHWHRFQANRRQAVAGLLQQVQVQQQQVQQLRQQLLDFCHQHMTDAADNPRLPLSPQLIKKLHHGMEAAAPVYIRPLLLSGRKMQEMLAGSVDAVKGMLAKARLIDKDALYQLKSQALDAQHLGESMRQTGLQDFIAEASQSDLEQTWARVIQKADLAAARLADQLDDAQIASSASNAWKNIPLGKKISAIGQGMLALLLSLSVVLLIPLGSPAAAVLAQASLPELIAAAGLGGLSGWGFAATSLARNLEQELFMPYFSDFFYSACDAFALPRQLDGQPDKIQLHNSQYALQATRNQAAESAAAWCQAPRYWRQNMAGFAQLEQHIEQVAGVLTEKKS